MSASLKTTYAALPRTTRGQNVLIGGDPKGKNFLYTCGISVITRNLEDPIEAEYYNEHSADATVARYAPSGYYICSADVHGNIRIWDTQNEEHLCKNEFRALSGKINDLQWSDDSKRIILAGEGRERFGAAIMWDTGNNVGEIIGHIKSINSVDVKQTRPFRVITAGEDFANGFYNAFPVKLNTTHKEHTRFVQCARFAPDGSTYVTSGSDGKVFIHDGKTGEPIAELGSPAHKGSVMAVSYSPGSDRLLTASADKTCKVWDIAQNSLIAEFPMGNTTDDQQLGCLWQGSELISIALGGWITYLDLDNPTVPKRVLGGHNKLITALAVSEDGQRFYTGSYEGRICSWDVATGEATIIQGSGHTNQICDLSIQDGKMISASMDDSVRFNDASSHEYGTSCSKVESLPVGMSSNAGTTVVACVNHVEVFSGENKTDSQSVSYTPASVAVSPDGSSCAVGGKDNKVHIYSISGGKLTETKAIDMKGETSCVAYSPCGGFLATGDSARAVRVYETGNYDVKQTMWVFHQAKVTALAWSSDSKFVVSGGIDCQLIVWSMEKPTKRISVKHAHVGAMTKVAFLNDNTVLSTGHDCAVKLWDITAH